MLNPVWKLHLSWLVLAAGGLWGISIAKHSVPPASPVPFALMVGYITWALYWGVPPFWRWWRRSGMNIARMARFLPGGCLIQAAIGFTVLFAGGYFFSVFGGGIYQFARHLRAAQYHA